MPESTRPTQDEIVRWWFSSDPNVGIKIREETGASEETLEFLGLIAMGGALDLPAHEIERKHKQALQEGAMPSWAHFRLQAMIVRQLP